MSETQIEAVVFDVGNVLIRWQPEPFYDAQIGEARRRALFAEVDLHEMNEEIDRGADFRKTVYDCAAAHPAWAPEIRFWHDRWLEFVRHEIDLSVRLMDALLARGVTVFALTNFGVGTWALATRHYPFLTRFTRAFVSGHMGVIKPGDEIYAMMEAECGVSPDRLLFTDDRADNIATAARRGWQTHHFTGPQGWADRLVAEGLLSAQEAR